MVYFMWIINLLFFICFVTSKLLGLSLVLGNEQAVIFFFFNFLHTSRCLIVLIVLFLLFQLVHADCAKHDPEVSEDTEKNFAELLTEELKLREAEALENQQRADMALLEAKKLTSQYQKEADKCNSGMETCEEAREKAEAALAAQKKLTATWEQRARQKGWREGITRSHAQSQGTAQAR